MGRDRGGRDLANSVERALRGVAVGRKNHYGSRSERGTHVAALFYSLIETDRTSPAARASRRSISA